MDHRAGVTADTESSSAAGPRTIQAEQAIFTSIRTPMGEGYRLIAASRGITTEERAEITRRCPSHGAICDASPSASALLSYPLGTARHCVGWTRYAGMEHTARGGQRVHTHLVVLEPDGFRAMQQDPFRVRAAMQEALGDQPRIKPSGGLECLELSAQHAGSGRSTSFERTGLQQACRVAAGLLDHDMVLVVGSNTPMTVLQTMFLVLPRAFRAELAVSANLQYASSRQIRLTVVRQNTAELQRMVAGKDVHVLDLAAADSPEELPFAAWFEFVLESGQRGRLAETLLLADELDGPLDGPTLARVAAVCHDADRVERASQATLEELVSRYADLQPAHPVEGRLVRHLLSGAVRRAAELQHQNVQACAGAMS